MSRDTQKVIEALAPVDDAKINLENGILEEKVKTLEEAVKEHKANFDKAIEEKKTQLLALDAEKLNPTCQGAHESYRATLQGAINDPKNCLIDPAKVFGVEAEADISKFLTEAGIKFLENRLAQPNKKDKLTLAHIKDMSNPVRNVP